MKSFLDDSDLIENPSAKLPVCLCLDTSASMLEIIGGEVRSTGRTEFRDGQTYNIVEGGITSLDELNDGLSAFFKALLKSDIARYSADVSIVTFDDTARVHKEFTLIKEADVNEKITQVGDSTALGAGVTLALKMLLQRKEDYKRCGCEYFQPWLVIMTDGRPSDMNIVKSIQEEIVGLEGANKLTVFNIAIGQYADQEVLNGFSRKKKSIRLKGENGFEGFFEWLGQSVVTAAGSKPGDKIKLDTNGIANWGDI